VECFICATGSVWKRKQRRASQDRETGAPGASSRAAPPQSLQKIQKEEEELILKISKKIS
jgi:hypothetical protein